MQTLDLLSQVLFVALMAMLLYVLYKRFVRMLTRDRLHGVYAQITSCALAENGRLLVAVESAEESACTLKWNGGEETFDCPKGRKEYVFELGKGDAFELEFNFPNQVIRRRVR
jgi:hypothetical protein